MNNNGKTDENLIKYINNMNEIKRRVNVLQYITSTEKFLGEDDRDYEVACINLRKILELISFSSLVANVAEYSKIHQKYATHWRAKTILTEIEKINPDFYPKPVTLKDVDSKGIKHLVDIEDGFLTRDEFIALYDKCSEVLHSWNPFDPRPRVLHFGYSVSQWVQRIQRLLGMHYISFVSDKGVWVINMSDPRDGKVHGFQTEEVEQVL